MQSPGRVIVAAFGAALAAVIAFSVPASAQPTPDALVSAKQLNVESALGDQAMGNPDAPVTVIEYASLTCPHCQNFRMTVFDDFKERYIDTGQVYFILREFPLNDLDVVAWMLARCAPGEDGFFATVDALFARQSEWVVSDPVQPLLDIVGGVGLTPDAVDACTADEAIFNAVIWSYDNGLSLGVSGTPTFFINGQLRSGVQTLAQLDAIIAPLLR